ncbi:MAG: hypothetical protein ACI959_000970, partial [Limisphaerales bacterium]
MNKEYTLLLFFYTLSIVFFCQAQVNSSSTIVVSGLISDTNDKALPFANVFVRQNSQGAAANLDGIFRLELIPGNYNLEIGYIGYTNIELPLTLSKDTFLQIHLEEEVLQFQDVVISGAEDPAMQIMRNAIAKRKEFRDEAASFGADVYIKGLQQIVSAPDKIMGFDLDGLGILDSNNAGIVYLSESQSRLFIKRPNNSREIMYASKISGDDQGFSWNEAKAMDFNWYENKINISDLVERTLISPLADNAIFFYRYKLLGTFFDEGRLINKIEIIPRRKNDPVFRGDIYIVEDIWRIHSTNFLLTKSTGVEFLDSLRFITRYRPLTGIAEALKLNNENLEQGIKEYIWMPDSRRFEFTFGVFGIKGKGHFTGIYSNYEINPKFEKRFFGPEILKIEEGSNSKDSIWWANNRPIPLTPVEINDYHAKDSLAELRKTKVWSDSVDRISNKFAPLNILFGYRHQNSLEKRFWQIEAPINLIGFNTIEGLHIGLSGFYRKGLPKNKFYEFNIAGRYGFSGNIAGLKGGFALEPEPEKFARYSISGGQFVTNYFENNIPVIANDIQTLFFEQNYLKLYESRYLNLSASREVTNGIFITLSSKYERRIALINNSDKTWIDWDKYEFTSNDPQNPEQTENETPAFPSHDALTVQAKVSIRIAQKYMSEPNTKYIVGSKWPEIQLAYKGGIPAFNSAIRFDKFSIGLKQSINLQLFGS